MDYSFLKYSNTNLAGLLAIFLLSYYILRRLRAPKGRIAPEAAGGWPLIGHLGLLGGSGQLPHITLGALADKYGPAFTIRVGVHPALVISTSELAKECFTTNDVSLCSRPKIISGKHFGYNYAMLAFTSYGPYWREIRKITSLELLSIRRLELLKGVKASEIETSLKDLYKIWTEKKIGFSEGHALVDLKQWFGDLSLNVILRMVAGKRYFGTSASSDEARRCQEALREFFHLAGLFVVGDSIPYLGWLDLGGYEKAMKKTAKELDCIVTEWLEEHKEKKGSGGGKGEQDFMDIMLSVLNGANLGGFDADTVTKATCLSMIAGGSDSTTGTLTWALSLLLNNPHVLRKAQEELDYHVGKGRLVNESDMNKLDYLQAIVKETLRLYPAAPLLGLREFAEDSTIGGYHVTKGTRLMVNLWKLQTDPRTWSEPLEFKPERFLTSHKDIDLKGHHFELLPFGSGRRACPGMAFGLQMTSLALASLLHAFEISTSSNEMVDMTGSLGLTNFKATPLDVLVKPRLPSFFDE
uniref:Cytochrome P450 n=1 Tax=Fagus sylvatica TaxID=28930 RepID=A0A2N9GV53_FAGSY